MMDKMTEAQNFLDLNGLNSIRQQSKSTDKESKEAALQTAAKQFEAIFMQMLLKSMRKAQEVLESDSPLNSESTKFYRDMHDQQMSLELSNNGSLGLSELIVRQLGGDSENYTPHTIFSTDNRFNKANVSDVQGKSIVQPSLMFNLSERQTNDSKNNQQNMTQASHFKQAIRQPSSTQAATDIPAFNSALNQTTPVPAAQYQQPKDFVSALTEPAKLVQQKLNVPYEVVIAQAALETGWGQKIIQTEQGESSNNLFNIKADSRWSGDKTHKETLEYQQGAMVKKREPFRVYQSIGESINDYINFLSTSERYQGALKQAGNVEHFLHKLQGAGYATDPNYANKIMGALKTVTNLINK